MAKEWIKETSELLEDWEAMRQELRNRIDQMTDELMNLEQQIEAGHELIRAYMFKHRIMSPTSLDAIRVPDISNKSFSEMVIDIGRQSGGVVGVADAADVIHQAIGGDLALIRHNVGNAFARSPHFTRISKGQYRFTNHVQDRPKLRTPSGQIPRRRAKSGVEQAIKGLKERNPQWTRKEVLTYLTETGFNFGGKQPDRAVRFVWGKLGYSKENKQQPLPIGSSVTVPVDTVLAVPLTSDN